MNLLPTSLAVAYYCLSCSAFAATASQNSADAYEACIIGLKHVTKAEIQDIGHTQTAIRLKADHLADLALQSCHDEKRKLESALFSEGEMDDNHRLSIQGLENASKQDVKLNILSDILRDQKEKSLKSNNKP